MKNFITLIPSLLFLTACLTLPSTGGNDTKRDFENITFTNASFEYDGLEHTILASNVPDFATVNYVNNSATEVGVYDATATISAENYNTLVLNAKLTITAPLLDFDTAVMSDLTVDYDGNQHTIIPTGFPTGTTVSYVGTKYYTKAGTYTITCKLNKQGYNEKTLSATLTINKIDFTGLVLEDASYFYDGHAHSIDVKNVPSGSLITYETDNEFVDVGVHEVQVKVTNPNFNPITLRATLTIESYADYAGVDTTKTAYKFTTNPTWANTFEKLLDNNYTLKSYSGSRASLDDPIPEPTSYNISMADGDKAYVEDHSASRDYETYVFYNTIGAHTIISTINSDSLGSVYHTKFPNKALNETVIQKNVAKAFMALQADADGNLVSGVDLDDFYQDVGSFTIDGEKITIKHEHKHGDTYFYEMYEFYNIGNTKIAVPSSLVPTTEEIENIRLTSKDFVMDGVEYGTHLTGAWNSDFIFMAHTYLYHWQQLILPKGKHFVLPEIYGKVVKRIVYTYSSEANVYNLSMNGYILNLFCESNGNYVGGYESLGSVTVSLSNFTSHGGTVKYWSEWALG